MHMLDSISFGFVNIAKPLAKLAEKRAFQWAAEVEVMLQTLNEALYNAPILAYQQPGERFVVDTNRSNVGIGGALC
jgi:hypothetical protein